MQNINAFKIKVDGKVLDYRLGCDLELKKVREFFERRYKVKKLWSGGRHVLGVFEKGGNEFFLKLATTEGISVVTQVEYTWNDKFNRASPRSKSNFWVPINYEGGEFGGSLFYLVTDRFKGNLLSQNPNDKQATKTLIDNLAEVINFSELIQKLEIKSLNPGSSATKIIHQDWFVTKAKAWLASTPKNVQKEYNLRELLKIVEGEVLRLAAKPRHGDFAPWHLFKLDSGQLGLIDGEHAMASSVEYYDIGYFIQRIFSVLKSKELAEKILALLHKRRYDISKLRVILAARAIGGFLDESLKQEPNFSQAERFKNWAISL